MSEESETQSLILEYLKRSNVEFGRNNTGASNKNGRMVFYGEKGSGDVRIYINGFINCEVKTKAEYKYILKHWIHLRDDDHKKKDSKKLRYQSQILFHEKMLRTGNRSFFCDSIEMFIELFNKNKEK